jgi:hypothetical protein
MRAATQALLARTGADTSISLTDYFQLTQPLQLAAQNAWRFAGGMRF